MMAGILLGLGEAVDPPSKHIIEAQEGEEKASPENDEPLEPSVDTIAQHSQRPAP
jgi:hypothetical protein